jgi:hypothetical protein
LRGFSLEIAAIGARVHYVLCRSRATITLSLERVELPSLHSRSPPERKYLWLFSLVERQLSAEPVARTSLPQRLTLELPSASA